MNEKRSAPRFRPGRPFPAAIEIDDMQLVGTLADISKGGFMLLVPEEQCRRLPRPGPALGEIHLDGEQVRGDARLCHVSQVRRGLGIGVSFKDTVCGGNTLADATRTILGDPKSGGLRLYMEGGQLHLAITGFLSYNLSHPFMHALRHQGLGVIDLSACHSMDSAGLGMMHLATDAGVTVVGADGTVLDLLQISGLKI